MYPFHAISQKADQILVPNMTDGFNFNSEFLLCLPPANPDTKSQL
jgi:hypothetical protein